ncbi:hypothetical protein [Enhydrobacter sp.]|jgi:uncharacterized membrane protein|uniref:BufA2 family periplasmic bufferin-type metallophore n=1 Tax=Enhydrobacter sp. TaxID=1894999 RepID=UPI00261303F6|nr:hypothetical protein [Enhydrobacter sp.]WIM09907.1 MAG: hypothetical protein OJF58_000860 [Enhydrobacter sp.]
MKKSFAVVAASLFAAATVTTATHAQQTKACSGINACKGQSACKSARNDCKGQNSCKGKGWVDASSVLECIAQGGTPMN